MKLTKLLPLLLVASLTACAGESYSSKYDKLFAFGTFVSIEMKIKNDHTGKEALNEVMNRLKAIDEIADATRQREKTNVWSLNQTNEKLEISEELYYLLARANELHKSLEYFNPLIGSLSNKWKTALNLAEEENREPTILTDDVIQEELAKINSSELILEETEQAFYAQRKGEALIDLGALAKGYALDKCLEYLNNRTGHNGDYLINAGDSSVLLGRNTSRIRVWKSRDYEEGVYVVRVTDIRNYQNLRIFNSFVSTSGISNQKAIVDGKTYSHIINPITGYAISNYDQITVVGGDGWSNGSLGDALSTSLMMANDENEIKKIENKYEVKVIAIKDGKIAYLNEGLSLYF